MAVSIGGIIERERRITSVPELPSRYPRPGTSSSKVHGTFYGGVSIVDEEVERGSDLGVR